MKIKDKKYIESARMVVARHCQHGQQNTLESQQKPIVSLGSERSYRACLSNYLFWCDVNNISPDHRSQKKILITYLEERSEWVRQKTLDQERNAIQIVFSQKIPPIASKIDSIYTKRSYSIAQAKAIIAYQSKKNKISTLLSFFSGLRAHEMATIRPVEEMSASSHRIWNEQRFLGLTNFRRYSVIGKGGLIREVAVPVWLSIELENRRRLIPKKVRDREIIYNSFYDIGFGQAFSQSFSSASKKAVSFSTGAHGLRHSYAKWRLALLRKLIELQESNFAASETIEAKALLILSQELGHFRLDITFTYLR